jgi:hypothetical protein
MIIEESCLVAVWVFFILAIMVSLCGLALGGDMRGVFLIMNQMQYISLLLIANVTYGQNMEKMLQGFHHFSWLDFSFIHSFTPVQSFFNAFSSIPVIQYFVESQVNTKMRLLSFYYESFLTNLFFQIIILTPFTCCCGLMLIPC